MPLVTNPTMPSGRRGLAAAREHGHQPIDTKDADAAARAGGLALAQEAGFGFLLRLRLLRGGRLHDRPDRRLDLPRVQFLAPYRGKEVVGLLEAGFRGNRIEVHRRRAGAGELALDGRPAVRERFLELLRLEPLTHLRPRAVARHVTQLGIDPVARGPADLRGNDLDPLAVLERGVERDHRAIDARAATAVAEARVHGVREIHGRGAPRQVDDFALGRQHVDRVGEEARAKRGQPFRRSGDVVLPVEHLPQPCNPVLEGRIAAHALVPAFLVPPMRGDAVLGMLVHLDGADLHFQRLALGTDDGRVQRTVAVGLRLRDVVVELAGKGGPDVVDDAERGIAVANVVDEDAHGADVVERVDPHLLAPHLVPDAGRCASAGR